MKNFLYACLIIVSLSSTCCRGGREINDQPLQNDTKVPLDLLYPVSVNGRYGYINSNGNLVMQPKFEGAFEFREGFARIIDKGKFGFINPSGLMVIDSIFDDAKDFADGLALVRISDKWGFIDHSGNFAIPLKYSGAYSFSEGAAAVVLKDNDGFGYINKVGVMLIDRKSVV